MIAPTARCLLAGCALLGLSFTLLAQNTGLSTDDRARIQELSARYAQALGACEAEAYADLFAPDTGYFASGFRGRFAGREQLIALVLSERHCSAGATGGARPAGSEVPAAGIEVTADGVRGTVRLGTAEYQDEYIRTPAGWRFASRSVVTAGEVAAGLDARDLLAINRLGPLAEYHEADQDGSRRLMTVGTRISVVDGEIRGRVFLPSGGYRDEVYEETAPGEWRVRGSTGTTP